MASFSRRNFFRQTLLVALAASSLRPAKASQTKKPNIIFLLADDLGYGDLGCYGQDKILTPHIDQMAKEGKRFTQFYAGAPVCSPSRCTLMTGKHTGHSRIRGNMCERGGKEGLKGKRTVRRMNLLDEDTTVADVMRDIGYRTGWVGKWHLAGYEPGATPDRRGFDESYGQLAQVNETGGYYPEKRFVNGKVVDIPENQDGKKGYYHTDLCTDEAISFIKSNKDNAFFLYVAFLNPHSPFVVPSTEKYADKPWGKEEKIYAAMVTHLDSCVGKILATLKEQGIDDNTLVIFTSDNGPRSEPSKIQTRVTDFFESYGPLRGYKRDLYEGGIREPFIVRWPGTVEANTTSDAIGYFPDMMPTFAEFGGGGELPDDIDGISVAPSMLGKAQDASKRFLYWEFYEFGPKQAVRWGKWKAVHAQYKTDIELYDLSTDIRELNNVADDHPEVVATLVDYMKSARTTSYNWPIEFWKQ